MNQHFPRPGTSDLPSGGRFVHVSRQTQEEIWITRMLLPRKFLSQLVDQQHCAAFKSSTFQPQGQQKIPKITSVRPAAQKYSMASPSASPRVPEMVGGWLSFNPFEKSTEEMGIMKTQTFGVKIKNTWKHHLEK